MDTVQDSLLNCLVHLTQQNHRPLSAEVLRDGLPLENNKLTPKLFVRAAKRAGFKSRVDKRDLQSIAPLTLPVVLLLKNDEACILQELDKEGGKAVIIQPESGGAHQVALDELAEQYSGYAIFVRMEYRFADQVSRVLDQREGHWFWGTIWRSAKIYRDVLIASFLINLFVLANPLFVMNVYDRVVPNSALETLWVLAIGVMIVYLFDFGLKMLRAYFIEIAGKKADILLSSLLFEKIMALHYSAMPTSVGGFSSNLREFESIRTFLSSTTNTIIIDIPFAIIFLIVIGLIGGPLVVVPLVGIPIIVIYSLVVARKLKSVVEKTFAASAKKNATLIECLTAMETVKTQRAASSLQLQWEQAVGYISHWGLKAKMLSSSVMNFAGFVTQVCSVALVMTGVYLIAEREITMGALIACVILSGRVLQPMAQVAGLVTNFHQSKAALEALDQIMQLPDEREAGRQYVHRPELSGKLEFKDVQFKYPSSEQASIEKVSFKINAGEKIALIGRIGSGKSTIEKLLMGLYRPDQGSVRIDDIDINQIDPVDLRRNIGYVPQDIMLFSGSVRDNIVMGSPEVDDERLIQAARIAGVDNFVNRHPHGFDMQVGERGSLLSGGQRQAVAIARGLIHEPNILILDEPTNSMDNSTEDFIRKQLTQYSKDKTLVLVTHKMSLLSLVERIVVIDGGFVVADGPKAVVLDALKQGRLHIQR
ncbi:type I secretion system permease/ATPase [Neptunomonas phycophila]|uniref:Type I secretion system permease/ATPase n=1 Tax=Neptunomonas phycophila TaxID=1572645 RepID=A0ABT9ERZ4_9GAMM|nr:type I secretion system permease/ATPase [Neptunomonas phycophila]MDP2521729.1 type I secretion system permease/ATPase [Neptunomonas phycophila]